MQQRWYGNHTNTQRKLRGLFLVRRLSLQYTMGICFMCVQKMHRIAEIDQRFQYEEEKQVRIPGTGEPAGLPSIGSHRVGHD